MQVSVVIPVWHGESVILNCLEALYQADQTGLQEVICVDNASADRSARLISDAYPQVRLLMQPVNLGFAGGVNAGIAAADGEVVVLLNQDCLVHDDWLAPLLAAFQAEPTVGIAGGTLYNDDGSVNHAGAEIERPLAYGRHLTNLPESGLPQTVDYVTGTLFAFRRRLWQQIGPLDEGFYPAYYEESDFCYRARHHGYLIQYVPGVGGTHLFSSDAWRQDPVKHNANQHRARYRFMIKHFAESDLAAFFAAESQALAAESYFDQMLGRWLAARAILRSLPDILADKTRDLDQHTSPAGSRQLEVGFTALLSQAGQRLSQLHAGRPDLDAALQANRDRLEQLRLQAYDLLTEIYFRAPDATEAETTGQRWWRLLVRRPVSLITLREHRLLARLNTLHVTRLDQMLKAQQLLEEQNNSLTYRLRLLEAFTDYEFR